MSNIFISHENFIDGFTHNILSVISILSIICGILVIISKNPVVSVLFLIGLFLTIASYLMILGISFIGLSYLLVYVGAVSILFLFILMLINVRISELTTDNNNSIPLSIITITIFNVAFYNALFVFDINNINIFKFYTNMDNIDDKNSLLDIVGNEFKVNYFTNLLSFQEINNSPYLGSSFTWDGALAETSHITNIGNILYTSYPMLLLITSIILLLAMIGSIVITLRK